MTTPWRVTADGRRQYLGSDGYWYTQTFGASTRQYVPPPPPVFVRPRSNRGLKVAVGIAIGILLMGVGFVLLRHSPPRAPSRAQLQSTVLARAHARFPQAHVRSAVCIMPSAWVPGKTYTCYLYGSGGTGLAHAIGTVLPSTGTHWQSNIVWGGP